MYIFKILVNLCFLAITCPSGMVYQQCGPSCPQTCDTNEDTDCSGGCVEGCFCPSGQVLSNGNCINETECQGTQDNVHAFVCILYSRFMYQYIKQLILLYI